MYREFYSCNRVAREVVRDSLEPKADPKDKLDKEAEEEETEKEAEDKAKKDRRRRRRFVPLLRPGHIVPGAVFGRDCAERPPPQFGPAPGENRFSHLDSVYRCAPQCSDIGPVVEHHPEELYIQLVPQNSVQKASLIFSEDGSIGASLHEQTVYLHRYFMVNIVPALHQCVEKCLAIEQVTSPLATVRHLSSQSFWAIQTRRQKKFEAFDVPFRLVRRLEKPDKSRLKDPLNILL
ncbi:hypothetical protein CTRI78_v007274 [Colletotrichum trifolii]|uniref:Uncharacterized protein n=1 Tax=Colletotrichum trifolii TaxID=5466 RepID=A0A4R8RCP6_COLTR|nr:hypothetical protein CTRI78_v007274 [Colletotrichum trifolii]